MQYFVFICLSPGVAAHNSPHITMLYVIQVCWQQTCMTYIIVVCRVKKSWWWTEELSETCRVLFQKLIWEISIFSLFYCKNLSRCTVTWTSIYHDARSPERQTQFRCLLSWLQIFSWSSSVPKDRCWEMLYVTSRSLPSAPFTIQYSVILPFDAVTPELLKASLSESFISKIYYKVSNF